jgi:uncharacterized protein (TIGR02449 family)
MAGRRVCNCGIVLRLDRVRERLSRGCNLEANRRESGAYDGCRNRVPTGRRPVEHSESNLPEYHLDQNIEILAEKVDELIETVRRLKRDNLDLRDREKKLNEEKTQLEAKNREAKKRLGSIITRLRQLGGETG